MTNSALMIGVVSARSHVERRMRCRRMWTHRLAAYENVIFRFFVGGGSVKQSITDREPDVVELNCPDDYATLPQKTREMLKWFLAHYEFAHVFKCDDDTYVQVERLVSYIPPMDYCGWDISRTFAGTTPAASGGAGYIVSHQAAMVAAAGLSDYPIGAEDASLAAVLAKAGVTVHHDERFRFNVDPDKIPEPSNNLITSHWVNSDQAEDVVLRPWVKIPKPRISAPEDLVLKIGSRVIRWVIGPTHDREFTCRVLLPWSAPDAVRLPHDAEADFTVCAFPNSDRQVARVMEAGGINFILLGEPEARVTPAAGCFQIVQDPRSGDHEGTRYGPILCIWSPPVAAPVKTRPCSAIESKTRPWRFALYESLRQHVGQLDGYGSAYGRPLDGYHCVGADPQVFGKYKGLESYAFSAAIERMNAHDYLTEKFTDPILCEAVPIYRGCTNITEYAVPGCYVPLEAAPTIDWDNWQQEYLRRRPAVLRQKELFRTCFNVLSYFIRLTGRLELLDRKRPLTIETAGIP